MSQTFINPVSMRRPGASLLRTVIAHLITVQIEVKRESGRAAHSLERHDQSVQTIERGTEIRRFVKNKGNPFTPLAYSED